MENKISMLSFAQQEFTCPECGETYESYWEGHDCNCGKIHLCNHCIQRHDAGVHKIVIRLEFTEENNESH